MFFLLASLLYLLYFYASFYSLTPIKSGKTLVYKPHDCRAIHSKRPSLINRLKMAAPSLIFITFLVSLSLGLTSSSRVLLPGVPAVEKNITHSLFDHTGKNINITINNITNSQSDQMLCDQPCEPSCIDTNPCCRINQPCCPDDDLHCDESGCNEPCAPPPPPPCNDPDCNEPCPPPPCGGDIPIGSGNGLPDVGDHVVRPKYSSAPSEQHANATAH